MAPCAACRHSWLLTVSRHFDAVVPYPRAQLLADDARPSPAFFSQGASIARCLRAERERLVFPYGPRRRLDGLAGREPAFPFRMAGGYILPRPLDRFLRFPAVAALYENAVPPRRRRRRPRRSSARSPSARSASTAAHPDARGGSCSRPFRPADGGRRRPPLRPRLARRALPLASPRAATPAHGPARPRRLRGDLVRLLRLAPAPAPGPGRGRLRLGHRASSIWSFAWWPHALGELSRTRS